MEETLLKRYALLVVTTASFITPFMSNSINLAIPSIGEEFKASAVLLGWVATSYFLASAAFLVPFGSLADIVGRKKIFITGLFSFSFFSMLCGLAWSVETLIIFRVLQGIASTMLFGTGMAILTTVFPPQERGKVLGINVSAVYVGLSMGPVLGGVLNHNFGWESIFFFNTFLAVAVGVLALYGLKGEWEGAVRGKYDFIGAALYMVGLVALMYGFSSVTTVSWAKYILPIGIVFIVLFIKHEMKITFPVLNITLFSKNTTFAFSNLAALINYSATFAVGFLLSIHLQVVLGYNSQTAGLLMLSQPVLMALLSPFAGRLSDRIEPRVVSSSGMALTAFGLLIFCFISEDMPLWVVVANLALLGTGFALFSSPNSNAVMSSVEKRSYGVASSTLGTMRLMGMVISMALVTLIIGFYAGGAELGPEITAPLVKGFRVSFVVFTVICLGGVFASLARGNILAERRQE